MHGKLLSCGQRKDPSDQTITTEFICLFVCFPAYPLLSEAHPPILTENV